MPRKKLDKPKFYLGRYKGKPNLYVKWTDSGAGKCISTGTEDEIAAKQFLAEFVAGWNSPPAEDQQTVNKALDAYLSLKKEEYKLRGEDTEHYKSNYRALVTTLPRIREYFGDLRLDQLTRQMGRDYTIFRKEAKRPKGKGAISNATIAKELSILNAAMNHVLKEAWIAKVPIMKLPPAPPPRDKWMTSDEVKRLLNIIETPHIKLFCLLALHTLSRKTAILQLQWSQVDMKNRLIDFNPPGRMETKKRRVPVNINNVLYAALEEAKMLRQSDYVIEYGEKPVREVLIAFKRSARKAKLAWVTPHTLRHTGATNLALKGEPMWNIAGLLGDSLTTTEKHYAKHHPDYQKSSVDTLEEMYG